MGKVILDITMSLDGFIAGPNDGSQLPLGEGGERLFASLRGTPAATPTSRCRALR